MPNLQRLKLQPWSTPLAEVRLPCTSLGLSFSLCNSEQERRLPGTGPASPTSELPPPKSVQTTWSQRHLPTPHFWVQFPDLTEACEVTWLPRPNR